MVCLINYEWVVVVCVKVENFGCNGFFLQNVFFHAAAFLKFFRSFCGGLTPTPDFAENFKI